MEQFQEVLSLVEATQSGQSIHSVLNSGVYGRDEGNLESDCVSRDCETAPADPYEVYEGYHGDNEQPRTQVDHCCERNKAFDRVLEGKHTTDISANRRE